MALLSNKVKDRGILKPGDHIYSYRKLHTYSHHGIYVEDNRVIHFTMPKDKGNSSSESSPCCEICGYQRSAHVPGLVKSCLDCFLGGHKLYLYEYNVSETHFFSKRSGTCNIASSDPPDVVVERAIQVLEGRLEYGNYDLFNNNCESFAVYCATGKAISGQALAIESTKVATAMLSHKLDPIQKNNNSVKEPFSIKNTVSTIATAMLSHKLDPIQKNNNSSSSSEKDQDNKEK